MGLKVLVQLLLLSIVNGDRGKHSVAIGARQLMQYLEEVDVNVELELGIDQDR